MCLHACSYLCILTIKNVVAIILVMFNWLGRSKVEIGLQSAVHSKKFKFCAIKDFNVV